MREDGVDLVAAVCCFGVCLMWSNIGAAAWRQTAACHRLVCVCVCVVSYIMALVQLIRVRQVRMPVHGVACTAEQGYSSFMLRTFVPVVFGVSLRFHVVCVASELVRASCVTQRSGGGLFPRRLRDMRGVDYCP
ncbi:hypothetical protein PLESTM_000658600 [Pleodorina starrii]|nr:hypothetical protein PLESTM_000658600 [Pleodorina starrii]